MPLSHRRISFLLDKTKLIHSSSQPLQLLSRLCNDRLREDSVLPIKHFSRPIKLPHQCKGSSGMMILTTSIVSCKDTQLTILRLTVQRGITWFFMLAHTSSCHILGIRILIVIMLNNSSSLWLRVNKLKYKVLRLKLKGSRDKKLLAWMLMSLSIG